MHTIQIRKKNSNVVEPIEIPQEIVPWIEIITTSRESRINLMEHKEDLISYLTDSKVAGASLVVRMLKHYREVFLIKH